MSASEQPRHPVDHPRLLGQLDARVVLVESKVDDFADQLAQLAVLAPKTSMAASVSRNTI